MLKQDSHQSISYSKKSIPFIGKVPCIEIDLSLDIDLKILSENICALIALNQPDNPIGLFQNPINETETLLWFIKQPLKDTDRLLELIEMMYESCNNPIYINIDINDGDLITAPLNSLIKRFYLPFNEGGIIDDQRSEQRWIWHYSLGRTIHLNLMTHFAESSNYFLINSADHALTTKEKTSLNLARLEWLPTK